MHLFGMQLTSLFFVGRLELSMIVKIFSLHDRTIVAQETLFTGLFIQFVCLEPHQFYRY